MFDEILPRNEADINSRIQLFVEEFKHPDNRQFFAMNVPSGCIICEKDHGVLNEFETPAELALHLFTSHGESPVDLVIVILDGILRFVLSLKADRLSLRGEFSN